VAYDAWSDYYIEVPSGISRLTVRLTNLSADGDLYVRRASIPDMDSFDCRSWNEGQANERC
jgi:serine protease